MSADLEARVDAVAERLEELREHLEPLRQIADLKVDIAEMHEALMRGEVRCRRLVVVDLQGAEVIQLGMSEDQSTANVIVNAPGTGGAAAILSACDVLDGDGRRIPSADLDLFNGAHFVAGISSEAGLRTPRLAVTHEDQEHIVAEATLNHAMLEVRAPGQHNTSVSLYADSGAGHEHVEEHGVEHPVVFAELYLSDRGEGAATLTSGGAYSPGAKLTLEDDQATPCEPLGGCGGRCYHLDWIPGTSDTPERLAWHDEFIRRMDNCDLEAVLYLIEEMELADDGENEDATPPYALEEFTDQHNWRDPVRVRRLAQFIRAWSEGRRGLTALGLVCKQVGIPVEYALRDMVANDRAQAERGEA